MVLQIGTQLGVAVQQAELLIQTQKQAEELIGLAIRQKYAQMLGGEIVVRSQLGQGSIFAFHISATPANTTEFAEQPIKVSGSVIGLAPQQPSYRILLVEDNATNRLLLKKLLSSIGFELQEAANGQEAIEVWQTWKPHLVFMDMRMPIMSGKEATQAIRRLEAQDTAEQTQTVILALTASAFADQRQEMLTAGCDDFISKPFKTQEIFEKIAQHLEVAYLYEETNPTQSKVDERQSILSSKLIQTLSLTWLDRLHLAANQGNNLEILTLIKEIPTEFANSAKALNTLAEEFQFDKILDAISKLRSSANL